MTSSATDPARGIYVSTLANVGEHVRFGDGVRVYGPAVIEDGVWLDAGVVIGYPCPASVDEARRSDDCDSLDALFDANVHQATVIGRNAFLRSGTVLYENVVVGDDLDCAHHVIVREGCRLEDAVELGPFAYLKRECRVGSCSRIASELCDRTVVGKHCTVYGRTSHRFAGGIGGLTEDAPQLDDGVVIGREACIIGGVKVGTLAFVGAGSVVTRSVREKTIVAGNPARFIRERDPTEATELWARVASTER